MSKYFRIMTLLCLLIFCGLSPAVGKGLEADMQSALYETQSTVALLQQKLNSGGTISEADYARLKGLCEGIQAKHLKLKDLFDKRQNEVMSHGSKAPGRHQDMTDAYVKTIEGILSAASTIKSKEDITWPALNNLKSLLDKALPKKKRPVYGSLPYRSLGYPVAPPDKASQITPAFMGGNTAVAAEDLLSTSEAPISKPIADLAESLHWNPVEIYEYVKNTIKTEWYWGCMKGAEETLRQKSGNDCDQAALSVGLAAGVQVSGQVRAGGDRVFPGYCKSQKSHRH